MEMTDIRDCFKYCKALSMDEVGQIDDACLNGCFMCIVFSFLNLNC